MKNFFINIKNYTSLKCNNIKSGMLNVFLSFKRKFIEDEDTIIVPCIGDIVEFEDGSRNMVVYSDVNIETGDVYVRFVNGIAKSLNNRGRQRTVLKVSSDSELWPPENSKIYRGSMLVYPSAQWRISFVNWLSKKLLK